MDAAPPPSPRYRIDSIQGWNNIGVELPLLHWDPREDDLPGGFPPIRRKPNAKSNYNPATWPGSGTCPVKAKLTKAKVQKQFLLTDFDLKDLVYTQRPAVRIPGRAYPYAEAHEYLAEQVKRRSWEKYGGPMGLEEARKQKKAEKRGKRAGEERNAPDGAALAGLPPPAPATPRRADRNKEVSAQSVPVAPRSPNQGTSSKNTASPERLAGNSSTLTPLQLALSMTDHYPDLSTPTHRQPAKTRVPAPFPHIPPLDEDVISINDDSEDDNVFKTSFIPKKSPGGNLVESSPATSSSSLSTPVKKSPGYTTKSAPSTPSPQKRRNVNIDDEVEFVAVTVTPTKNQSVSPAKRRKLVSPDKKQVCMDVIEISD